MEKLKVAVMLLILSILISGCDNNQTNTTNKPEIDLFLEPSSIIISESTSAVKLTLTKKDSESPAAFFVIQLDSPEEANVYFIGENGEKISSINTTLFENKGDRKVYPLTIKAKKDSTKDEVAYTLNIRLSYNGEDLGNTQKLKVRVI